MRVFRKAIRPWGEWLSSKNSLSWHLGRRGLKIKTASEKDAQSCLKHSHAVALGPVSQGDPLSARAARGCSQAGPGVADGASGEHPSVCAPPMTAGGPMLSQNLSTRISSPAGARVRMTSVLTPPLQEPPPPPVPTPAPAWPQPPKLHVGKAPSGSP